MFLAVCRNNLLSCVRGHVPSLNCSNVAATRCPKLLKGAPAAWCQKALSRTTRTDLSWHHRLKQKVCRLGQWSRLAHNGKLHDRKSTFNDEGISGQGHPQPVTCTPLPKIQESCLVLKERTNTHTPAVWRSKPLSCCYNLQVFDSTRVFNVRVPLASLSVHSGVRGFCCPNPRKNILDEELSSSQQDSRESLSCEQDAKPTAPQHEHFQFKELVS